MFAKIIENNNIQALESTLVFDYNAISQGAILVLFKCNILTSGGLFHVWENTVPHFMCFGGNKFSVKYFFRGNDAIRGC